MKKLLLLLPVLIMSFTAMAQKKSFAKNADGGWYFPTGNHGLKPGDTLLINGDYAYSLFEKVNGTADKPIVFFVESSSRMGIKGGYGLLIQNSSFFKVVGNNKLKIGGTSSAKYLPQALGLLNSTDYEISGCEMLFANVGIYSNGWGYHMKNISIHDNVIHDLDNPEENGRSEGIYFGNTGIKSTKDFSFRNIKIFRNKFYRLSGDGIQLALAINYEVYENTIDDYGRAKTDQQQNEGIIIGSGSSGRVYNNTVSNGSGSAFQCFGAGRNYFDNNVAINTCRMANEDLFYIGNRSPDSATVVYITNNKGDKTSRDFIRKEANTTVYQSGNVFGGTVIIPVEPPAATVPKAQYDSLLKNYNTALDIISGYINLYNEAIQKNKELNLTIDSLNIRLAELEAWKKQTIDFINRKP